MAKSILVARWMGTGYAVRMPDTNKKPIVRRRRSSDEFTPDLNPEFSNVPMEAEQPTTAERTLHVLWEVIKTVAFIVLAAVFIRAFVVQPFFVQGESMEPSFHEGDYLLVNQLSYQFGKPSRGDVVVFKAPPDPEENYIKRIIGLPGETVELKNGRVYVSNERQPEGVALDEPYIAEGVATRPDSLEGSAVTRWELGPDQYFVIGDNREPGKSSDSRAWGPVNKNFLIGKTAVRVYPLANFGFVKHQNFPNLSFGAAGRAVVRVTH